MSAVDVLSVLSHHEAALRAKCGTPLNELAEARAAVAELIEAADAINAHPMFGAHPKLGAWPEVVRLAAALARCRGGAA